GPVGGATSRGCFGRWSTRSPARWPRPSWRGRAAALSMTTRRLRPEEPPRGLRGLLGRSAIRVSVKARQRRIDVHLLPQRPAERAARRGALETGEPPARIRAPSGPFRRGHEPPVPHREADQLPLRRAPPAADAPSE